METSASQVWLDVGHPVQHRSIPPHSQRIGNLELRKGTETQHKLKPSLGLHSFRAVLTTEEIPDSPAESVIHCLNNSSAGSVRMPLDYR